MNKIDQNLLKNNIILPEPASPVATYVPYNISEICLYISGQDLLMETN